MGAVRYSPALHLSSLWAGKTSIPTNWATWATFLRSIATIVLSFLTAISYTLFCSYLVPVFGILGHRYQNDHYDTIKLKNEAKQQSRNAHFGCKNLQISPHSTFKESPLSSNSPKIIAKTEHNELISSHNPSENPVFPETWVDIKLDEFPCAAGEPKQLPATSINIPGGGWKECMELGSILTKIQKEESGDLLNARLDEWLVLSGGGVDEEWVDGGEVEDLQEGEGLGTLARFPWFIYAPAVGRMVGLRGYRGLR